MVEILAVGLIRSFTATAAPIKLHFPIQHAGNVLPIDQELPVGPEQYS